MPFNLLSSLSQKCWLKFIFRSRRPKFQISPAPNLEQFAYRHLSLCRRSHCSGTESQPCMWSRRDPWCTPPGRGAGPREGHSQQLISTRGGRGVSVCSFPAWGASSTSSLRMQRVALGWLEGVTLLPVPNWVAGWRPFLKEGDWEPRGLRGALSPNPKGAAPQEGRRWHGLRVPVQSGAT